ncbi:hypothetical protein J9303_07585 [Bacillaceae bacterium Marseille-Q3522]|nr:hypothetical protein [Bacillaceae bacterium Marseille-Q3522]
MINKHEELTQEQVFNLYSLYSMLYYLQTQEFNGKLKLMELGYSTKEYVEAKKFIVREELIDYYNKNVNSYEERNLFSKVIDWADRNKTENFLKQLKRSEKFEVAVKNFFLDNYSIDIGFFHGKEQYMGESKVGIEIKNDRMSEKTGNYAIECYEKLNGFNKQWVKSGILKEDNTEYFFMGYGSNELLQYKIFKKATLLNVWYHREQYIKDKKIREYSENDHGTSKGYLILKNSIEEFEESIDIVVSFIRNNYPDSVIK